MSELIERVARAICTSLAMDPDQRNGERALWTFYRGNATAAITAMNQWQPIETAPKDGKPFEAWYVSSYGPSFGPMEWRGETPNGERGYFFSYAVQTESRLATHWRPAPEPPETQP